MTIESFRGQYAFLSNGYPSIVWLDNLMFGTCEHAFQAAKTLDLDERIWVKTAIKPFGVDGAKKRGRSVTLRPDWEDVKVDIMLDLVWHKFQLPHLRPLLLATEGETLVEGNTWNDTFWGVCAGRGQNVLGLILTAVRDQILHDILTSAALVV